MQQRLFRAELGRVVDRSAPGTSVLARLDAGDGADEHLPLVRVMVRMERLSRREQELAADLLAVIASHGESGDA
jgi:hypothetical protein